MSLTAALDIARSGLSVTSGRTALVSRNIVGASEPLASRKIANVISLPGGGIHLASTSRAANSALLAHMLGANSIASQQRSIASALDRLDATVLDPELDASPAALIGKFKDALQLYSTAPHDMVAAQSAVSAARDLAQGLNDATKAVQALRQQTDAEIASTVDRLNQLLSQFEAVNKAVVDGTRAGSDVTDYLDNRDRLLQTISEEIGIRTMVRADNDMVLFTDSGVTLFETKPRPITFEPTLVYTAGTLGNPVFVDGVQVTGAPVSMPASGRLAGLTTVRDEIATNYQNQLDEIARGLIEVFAETDQSAVPTLPDAPSLFTFPGAVTLSPSGGLVTGLAGLIMINPNVDPAQGGSVTKLRDGGIAGGAYDYNPTGAASFTDRLQQVLDRMSEQRAFDPGAQLSTSANILSFASSSVAWLGEYRMSASAEADYRGVVFERSSEALNNATGVNLDEEMTVLLNLERSYQATSRLISTIDEMFRALLSAAG